MKKSIAVSFLFMFMVAISTPLMAVNNIQEPQKTETEAEKKCDKDCKKECCTKESTNKEACTKEKKTCTKKCSKKTE